MTARFGGYHRRQAGYTLVEVIITVAIGSILMAALSSVVFTAMQAAAVATGRVEASAQIRHFESFAYDDFARSGSPNVNCPQSSPCTTQPIVLTGTLASNAIQPIANPNYQVSYTWDPNNQWLDRQAGPNPSMHAATSVSSFSWYIDTTAAYPTVVVNLTVTVHAYSNSQTFRFYPRFNP